LVATTASNFEETLSEETRSTLYCSLAGTTGVLLGFVISALAILVALPSTDRLDALQKHPKWERVPSAYFRASRALVAAVILCTLGIPLDSASDPWKLYEYGTVVVLALALTRVGASLVALDQILAVARAPATRKPIDDPGP
jgi:hypothetical protein